MHTQERPYAVLARRRVEENTKWTVWFDHLRQADGSEEPAYLVLEPKVAAEHRVTGVVVLPVVADGRIRLARTWRHAIGEWGWEAVRGFCDPGETPAEAGRRELVEEAGLDCGAGGLRPLGHATQEGSTIAGRIALFAALGCVPTGAAAEPELGVAESRLFESGEIAAMATGPDLQDACTMVVFYRHMLTAPSWTP